MCGIAGIFGPRCNRSRLNAMIACQRHRGPDACGNYVDPAGGAGLGHTRLSIVDLSESGRQPMSDVDGRYHLVFNGEIYNYLELRRELSDYPYRSRTDSEVLLAAYRQWGEACLDRLTGMFALAVWDESRRTLFAARDRFGVKPLYYAQLDDGTLLVASEIKALQAAGAGCEPDEAAWATYLAGGAYDHTDRTFWKGIRSLPAGHRLRWKDGHLNVACWYDLAERVEPLLDRRPTATVCEEYLARLKESVALRFRSDVPVGVNLSGGLDSSVLLGLVQAVQGPESDVQAFTFVTDDPRYDELPWVRAMLAGTRHSSVVCPLAVGEVPDLAESVQEHQDEPFGGLPTLAYAQVFREARARGVLVLLDGQGMDEQWAGYDYYARAVNGNGRPNGPIGVQGSQGRPTRPECLVDEFRVLAEPLEPRRPFGDAIRNLQYRDARYTKIPRALRFNDRISMRASVELREPFMDHRLFELAMRQPADRKILGGMRKWMLRQIAAGLLPRGVVEAPKRPLQTPQREWLRGPLRSWAQDWIDAALADYGGRWLSAPAVRAEWAAYQQGTCDSSFHVWQWISLGLCAKLARRRRSIARCNDA